jgi:type I restriction-modification system DNA methylase subunit
MTDESQYFQFVGEEHRRQFGQYFTHPLVAQFMVDWVLESGVPSLYDPSFGMGLFWMLI